MKLSGRKSHINIGERRFFIEKVFAFGPLMPRALRTKLGGEDLMQMLNATRVTGNRKKNYGINKT